MAGISLCRYINYMKIIEGPMKATAYTMEDSEDEDEDEESEKDLVFDHDE